MILISFFAFFSLAQRLALDFSLVPVRIGGGKASHELLSCPRRCSTRKKGEMKNFPISNEVGYVFFPSFRGGQAGLHVMAISSNVFVVVICFGMRYARNEF